MDCLAFQPPGASGGSFWIWAIDGQTMSNMGGIHGNIWGYMKLFEVTICYYRPHRPHIMKAISAISFNMTYNILNNGSSSSVTAKGGMDHDGPSKKAFPDFVTWSLTNFLEGRPEKLLEYKHQHGLNWIWLDDVGCIHDVFMMYSAWKQGLSSTCWSDYTIAPLVWRT